jgi:GDP-mannose 6-dehydrogenase
MIISIFGLGYVGAVTAACLTERGHRVIGEDVNPLKVAAFNAGQSPIVEPELGDMMRRAHDEGLLSATSSAADAVAGSDVSLVCVGTPSLASGRLNLDYVRKVCAQLREAILAKAQRADCPGQRHLIIMRSTMLPGSTRALVAEFFGSLLEGGLLEVWYCPEFLREGSAVRDFREPSLAVVGTSDGEAPPMDHPARELLGPLRQAMTWEAAEMLKYGCNYLHALKVTFANEIGRMAKHLGIDGRSVMDVICQDERLNISRAYLRPGNPFGGSCLPKDVSALASASRIEGVPMPLLEAVQRSNEAQLDWLIKLVTARDTRRIGLLGLAFKADTDDLRGSPMVAVAETLLGRGYQLSIYDPSLQLARLTGANEADIQRRMPHLASLLRNTAAEVVAESDGIIASQRCAEVTALSAVARPEQWVIDVNGWPDLADLPWDYEGICW